MDKEMQTYFNIIIEALDCVTQPFYNLKTTYELTGIVRERVFCYELYHHIRCIQTQKQETRLTLNGEIDKRGHQQFEKSDQKNPDFVFHIPGEMSDNTLVVEVKGTAKASYIDKCIEDFKKLEFFVDKYQYKAGIFILYNCSFKNFTAALQNRLRVEFREVPPEISEKIYVVCKENACADTEVRTLREILD